MHLGHIHYIQHVIIIIINEYSEAGLTASISI